MRNVLLLLLLPIAVFSLDADYNGGEELILVERERTDTEKFYDSTSNKFVSNTNYIHTGDIFDLSVSLYSIYWNPATTNYYYVKDGSRLTKTNGLSYKFNPKKEEKTYTGENFDPHLQYVGYISTNQRLYVDKRDNQQYIKTLEPINDPIVTIPDPTFDYKTGKLMFMSYKDIVHKESFGRSRFNGRMPLGYD